MNSPYKTESNKISVHVESYIIKLTMYDDAHIITNTNN